MEQIAEQPGVRCLFSCAEPAWASVIPERHMVGLLNVCCLFSPTVYLTDVHLGDNPVFLSSYTSGSQDGLYARVRELAKLGCIRLLLRDESVRAKIRTLGMRPADT